MVGIFHERGYLGQESEDQRYEERSCGSDGHEHRGIDSLRVFLRLVDIAEEGGLHAVSEDDKEERRIGVDVGDDAVLSARCGKGCCLNGHKQVVDEATRNAAKTVDGGVLSK